MARQTKSDLDHARDELFSHIRRCGALNASEEEQERWLAETIEYVSERYPHLSAFELTQVELMGRRYLRPAIPHGSDSTAQNRGEWQSEETVAEA